MGGRGWAGRRGMKGGKWDNCNSIINKIYFLKNKNKIIILKQEPAAGEVLLGGLWDTGARGGCSRGSGWEWRGTVSPKQTWESEEGRDTLTAS